MMKKSTVLRYFSFFLFCLLGLFIILPVFAADKEYYLSGNSFELSSDSNYDASGKTPTQLFTYGRQTMGTFYVSGSVSKETTYNGRMAYEVDTSLQFGYKYDGAFQTNDKDSWNLFSEEAKTVNGISLGKKVKSGAVLVLKSHDGVNWENAADPITDFFAQNKNGSSNLFTTPEEEINQGIYYRVIVAYSLKIRTAQGKIAGIIPTDTYESIQCLEIYDLFVSSESNTITFVDFTTHEPVTNLSSLRDGFYVLTNGSIADITVSYNSITNPVHDRDCFTLPGTYNFTIKAPLGTSFSYTFTVTEGLKLTALTPSIFESKKDSGFPTDITITSGPVFGTNSWSSLYLTSTADLPVTKGSINQSDAYGIGETRASIYLRLNASVDESLNGWTLQYDKWGKKAKETIFETNIGEIGTGTVIVQKSYDGIDWIIPDSTGTPQTDYPSNHESNIYYPIFQPTGEDIRNGIYVRVSFLYQIYNQSQKDTKDYVEQYTFYLCYNNLGVILFHNLTIQNTDPEILGDSENVSVQILTAAESLLSGDYTTTGFSIDTSNNPNVSYIISKDGKAISKTSDNHYTEPGRYQIHLTSILGDQKDVIIYVDTSPNENFLQFYFGDVGFLSGKRILAEGNYPTYVAGETQYNIASIPQNYLPISGVITNIDTGSEITIDATTTGKTGILTEPGEYVATFTTQDNYDSSESRGDTRIITFHFNIVSEAPGPVINQNLLSEYAVSTFYDVYPRYYGLPFPSAGSGSIILAFSTFEAAYEYAYNSQKGNVEKQPDGTYRYTGNWQLPKQKYTSETELTNALYDSAKSQVKELYFNPDDQFTCQTLLQKDIDSIENLRQLELYKSIIVFAEDQKELMIASYSSGLPLLNDKTCYYLNDPFGDSEQQKIVTKLESFEFTTDEYGGIDSSTVIIRDVNNKEYTIPYGESVGAYLAAQGCASGIVTIIESTKYGDTAEYKALYISPRDNHTEFSLVSYKNGQEDIRYLITQNTHEVTNSLNIMVDAFSIADIVDDLDPYSLIIVQYKQGENLIDTYYLVADEKCSRIWVEPGNYIISCVNRIGYKYELHVTIEESDTALITFVGEGTEGFSDILTTKGSTVELKQLEDKYGYTFAGYSDETGNLYTDETTIDFTGEKIFTPTWKPKQITIEFHDENDNLIESLTMHEDFGKEVSLPIYESPTHREVLGWKYNGESLPDNKITITSEDTIILIVELGGLKEEPMLVNSVNTTKLMIIMGTILLLGIVSLTIGLTIRNKRRHKKK